MWSRFASVIWFRGRVHDRAIIVQHKTKLPVQFELMATARKTIRAWLERRGGTLNDYIFPNRNDYMAHMSTRQYARLVREWVIADTFGWRVSGRGGIVCCEGAKSRQA